MDYSIRSWTAVLPLIIIGAVLARADDRAAELPIVIVNHSDIPVHAAAVRLNETELRHKLDLPEHAAVRFRAAEDGTIVPVTRGTEADRSVVRLYVSLAPRSPLDLIAQPADRWEEFAPADAQSGEEIGTGSIRNGILRATFGKRGWDLGFTGTTEEAESSLLVTGGKLDFWVDDQNRGRIMNVDPRELGLARYADAALESSRAWVEPDGRAMFRLVRRMDGLAGAMTVTETFELPPGEPILIHRVQWRNEGDAPLWVAYTGSGNGVFGRWAKDGLMAGPLVQRKKSPIQGDIGGGETRPAWLPHFCCTSMESPATGCGFGMSTLLPTPKSVGTGSMIWGVGAHGFQCNFIDPVQGQFPFLVEPKGTLENGFAFLATQTAASTYRQLVELWRALQSGKMPALAPPCAVYVGDEPLDAQTVLELSPGDKTLGLLHGDGPVRRAALRMDFNKHYELRAAVRVSAEGDALEIAARPLAGGETFTLLRAESTGEHVLPLNEYFKKDEIAFVLETTTRGGALLEDLSIAETLPVAPAVLSPLPEASFTDIATMFRWIPLPMVVDYDIQWSRSEDFAEPEQVRVRQSQETPWYLPPDDALPAPGTWYWRMRGGKGDVLGAWSPVRRFTVNDDHSTKPPKRPITARSPLFTLEASKVTDFRDFTPEVPADVAPHVAIIVEGFVAKHLTIEEAMRD